MRLRFATAATFVGAMATNAFGQLPAIPAAPPVAAPAVPAVPAAPALPSTVPPARNIWSFFMLTPDQKAACMAKKEKFCRSSLGQLINNAAKPAAAFTGGLLPSCCPPSATDPNAPNPDDLKKPATEAEGAAARIKELEAGAAARRSAVRYLGTVDCKRFPEAETALIGALRTDTNECVRYEAATALARGCCCTTKTIKALTLTAEGTDTDGNPAETSNRVRTMAAMALARCCGAVDDSTSPKELPPELPPERPSPETTARRTEMLEREKALAAGRRVVSSFQTNSMPGVVTGRRTVLDTFRYATALAAPSPIVSVSAIVPNTPTASTIVPAAATMPLPTTAATPPTKAAASNLPTGQRGLFNLMWASRKPDG